MTNKNKTLTGEINFSAISIGLPMQRPMSLSTKQGSTFIPFSGASLTQDTTNIYPQILAGMYNNSPTHASCVKLKKRLVQGEGFDLENIDIKLKDWLNNINDNGETLNDILSKVAMDYMLFGGVSLSVGYSNSGKIISVKHIPFIKVRVGEPNEIGEIEHYTVSNNWDNKMATKLVRTEEYKKFNPNLFKNIPQNENGVPTPTEIQQENAEQLIYWFDKSPDVSGSQEYYPLPNYINCVDSIKAEMEINASNSALLLNGFGSKTIILNKWKPVTAEERHKEDYRIKAAFTGSYNNGGVVNIFGEAAQLPEIHNVEGLKGDTYQSLLAEVKRNICTGHEVPNILIGVETSGGFNNRGEEMATAISIFQQTYINAYQIELNKLFSKIVKFSPFGEVDLQIKPFKLIPYDEYYKSTQPVQTNNNETSITTN